MLPVAQQPVLGQGLLNIEASRSHSGHITFGRTPAEKNQPNSETCTWQQTTLAKKKIFIPLGIFFNWSTFISISLHQLHCAYVLTAITKIRGASPIGQQCDTCSSVWSLYEVGHWFRLDLYGHVTILTGHKMVSTAHLRISSGQVCAVPGGGTSSSTRG